MLRLARFLLVLPCLLVAGFVSGQEAATRIPVTIKDIDASLESEWFGVYFQGKKIGYINSARSLVGKGPKAHYRETQFVSIKLLSFGQKAEIKHHQVLDFDAIAPFALRAGHAEESDGKTKQITRLTRTDKGYEHVHIIGKREKKQLVDKLDFTLADAMTQEMWVKKGIQVGDRTSTRTIELKDLEMPISNHKVLAKKSSLVSGVKVDFYEIETTLTKTKLTILARWDSTGHMLSGVMAIFELRKETEEQAKNTEFSQDLFVLGQVKIQKKIGKLREASSVVMQVKGVDKDTLRTGPRQEVVPAEDGSLTLKLGKAHQQKIKAGEKEIAENLKETRAYHTNHPKIKELAAKAVGDAKTPEEKVKNLVKFVHNFVQPNLSVATPNIPDLLEHKKGDCKSYALLFVTLARAAGIPAREVGGLAYMGDDTRAFGGHAWNEVILNGVWVPVDAAFNQVEVDAGHIDFGAKDDNVSILRVFGKMKLHLVEAK